MGDIELKHSATGSTWQKKGAKYISRVRKNGKWVYQYANEAASKAMGVNKKYIQQTNVNNSWRRLLKKTGKPGLPQETIDRYKRVTGAKSIALQKQARKRKLHAASVNVQRNVNKGKKKVSELIERLQNAYEDQKRRYAGKKAGRKSAKLSKERQKRLKQKNTIKLNKKQRVTFSDVKIR